MRVIFALLDPDPYPDPLNRLNPDPIRIRNPGSTDVNPSLEPRLLMYVGLSRLYVTRIKKAFACDVFFPVISSSAWTTVRDEQVPHEEQVIYLPGYLVMNSQ